MNQRRGRGGGKDEKREGEAKKKTGEDGQKERNRKSEETVGKEESVDGAQGRGEKEEKGQMIRGGAEKKSE